MIGERSELVAQLLRYHSLVHGVTDSRAREALRSAIAGIERRLAELDGSPLPKTPAFDLPKTPGSEARPPVFRAH